MQVSIKLQRVLQSGLIILIAMGHLAGCATKNSETTSSTQSTLIVLAAASLSDAFQEIGAQFEQSHPGVRVTFNFAGSQQLAQQINEGAPADIFASADENQIDAAASSGRVDPLSAQNFAGNWLVVIFPHDNPAGISSLQDLSKPGTRIVLAASEVPAGKYSLEFLKKASGSDGFVPTYAQDVAANVVSYEENVRGVLAKVALGEADAGIVYETDAAGNSSVQQLEIPAPLNISAGYWLVLLKDSAHLQASDQFVDYVLSKEGQAVLSKYGFESVDCGCDP
jgi:molybdate transport system substrate-binding protein